MFLVEGAKKGERRRRREEKEPKIKNGRIGLIAGNLDGFGILVRSTNFVRFGRLIKLVDWPIGRMFGRPDPTKKF
jgi:hypothetical protein